MVKSTRIVYVLKSWLMISLIILAVSATSAVQAGDYIPLKVIHTDPGNGATDVFTNVMVKAYLSKKANQETINVFSVTLSDGASEIGGQVEYDAFENEISFIPATPLIENTTYYAVVSTAVEDLENKPLAKRKEWVFTTRGKDVIRPVITYASPSPDSELVPRSTVINIVFSEPIIEETLTTGTVMLSTDLEEIEGELDYDNSTRTLTFRPSRELEYETRYQVNVMDWIKDLNGNSLPAKAEWSFVSELPPDTEPPSIVDVYPEAKKREVSVTTEVVVHFSEIVLSADLSIFSFSLRDGDKTVPGRLDYDYKKKEARFIPDGMLQYGRLYTAEIKKGIRDLAGNRLDENYRWSFATIPPPDVEPPMVIKTFPMDGDRDISVIVGLKTFFTENLDMATLNEANVQLYLEENTIPGKVDFDEETKTLSFNPIRPLKHGTKYLFMLRRGVTDLNGNPLREEIGTIFQTEPPPDVYPPKVVAAYPAVGAVNVPLDTDISIVFDEEIQKTTLNLFTFTVSEMKINTYGDMTYLRGEKKGTFKPKELLSYDTLYQVKIFNIKDLAGNRMSDVFTWSFMTLPAPDTTPPAVDITSPEDGTEGVPVNFPVNVRFTEPVKPESVNEFTFLLSDGLNNIAGMVSYNQEAKTATFEHKDPLIPGKIYWAHLSHLIQDLVGNELGEDYVWKFTTVPPPDLEPPHIIRYIPGEKEVNVDVTDNVAVFFSEDIDARSLNPFTLRVQQGKKVVTGKISYFDKYCCATFTPDQSFEYGKEYVAEIGTGVLDMAGNSLERGARWVFRTISRQKVAGMDIRSAYTYFETNPFPDLPRNHWSYNAIKELARRGFLNGYEGTSYNGDRSASRYEVAMTSNRIIENAKLREKVDLYEALLIEKLVAEFNPELSIIGARITEYRDRIAKLGIEIDEVKTEVAQLKKDVSIWKKRMHLGLNDRHQKMMALFAMALVL